MVAESKEKMTEVFDTWTDNVRVAMDAGRRSQEGFMKVMGDFWKTQPELEGFYTRSDRMAREFVPFVNRNVQTASECAEHTFRTGMDMIKVACDTVAKTDDQDVYRRMRNMWDAAFGATRANFETFGKAGTRMIENFSDLMRTACTCCGETGPKSATKPMTK